MPRDVSDVGDSPAGDARLFPSDDELSQRTIWLAFLLVLASVAPSFSGLAGTFYLVVALALSAALFGLAVRFLLARNEATARALFFGSITYLPLLWIALIGNKL